jgi:hypothetical protein
MSDNNYLDLYKFSNQEYKQYLKSTISTEFVLDPLLGKRAPSEFTLDRILGLTKKEFVLDPQFPQYKLNSIKK